MMDEHEKGLLEVNRLMKPGDLEKKLERECIENRADRAFYDGKGQLYLLKRRLPQCIGCPVHMEYTTASYCLTNGGKR